MTKQELGLAFAVVVLAGVGLLLVVYVGLGALRRQGRWESQAARTTATIVRYHNRRYKGGDHHYPIARFAVPGAAAVEFEADRPKSGAAPPAGGTLDVLYDRDQPSVARLPGQDSAGAYFVIGVGLVFLVVAVFLMTLLLTR